MRLALEEAALCKLDVPVGALIIKDSRILALGHNLREELNDPLGHAELLVIKAASKLLGSWRLSGCTLICTLEPCPMCAEAIIQSRISTLVFGAYDTVAGAAGTRFNLFANRKSLPTPELITGILELECSASLKEFFQKQRQDKSKID